MLGRSAKSYMNIFQVVKDEWLEQGIELLEGEQDSSISTCFESFGITPSRDLYSLFRSIGGMDNMDEEYFRLWSLEEILEYNLKVDKCELRRVKYGVIFGDYLIDSIHYRVNKAGEVLVDYYIEGNEPESRSNSISQFFSGIYNDPRKTLT